MTVEPAHLPNLVLPLIFDHLTWKERCLASTVCKEWYAAFHSRTLWRTFTVSFVSKSPSNTNRKLDLLLDLIRCKIDCITQYEFVINQYSISAKSAGVAVLVCLTNEGARVKELDLRFTAAENPFLYSGQDYVAALCGLFESQTSMERVTITAGIRIKGQLLATLYASNRGLRHVNITNSQSLDSVDPSFYIALATHCLDLTSLHIRYADLSSAAIRIISARLDDRVPFQELFIKCGRHEKFCSDIPPVVWRHLHERYPDVRVTFEFDSDATHSRISEILCSEIPLTRLSLLTFTDIDEELRLVASQYCGTLIYIAVAGGSYASGLLQVLDRCRLLEKVSVYESNPDNIPDAMLRDRLLELSEGEYTWNPRSGLLSFSIKQP